MIIAFFLIFILMHLAIGLAIGYFLLYLAVKQEEWLRTLGLVFGWLIIALTVIFMLYSIILGIKCKNNPMRYCPMHYMMMKKAYTMNNKGTHCNEQAPTQMIQNVNPVVKEETQPQSNKSSAEKILNPNAASTKNTQANPNTQPKFVHLRPSQNKAPSANESATGSQTAPGQTQNQ